MNPVTVIKATDLEHERYYLIDGFHRVEAHYKADLTHISANVIEQGDIHKAIYLSLSANAEHDQALLRLKHDIINAAETATQIIFDAKKCLDRNSSSYNPFPKVEVEEVVAAVKCSMRIARNVCAPFNNRVKEARDRSVFQHSSEGWTDLDIAEIHNVSVNTVRNIVDRIEKLNLYENKRGSGWSRQRTLDYETTGSETGYKGKPRYEHRVSEPDFQVEADLTEYLLSVHFLDANKNVTELNCATGRVDILTDDEVIEVKRRLDRKSLQSAIGQLMLYKNFFKKRKLTIAGMFHNELTRLAPYIGELGIDIILIHSNGDIERYVKGVANGI
ncbi:ParB N-terminal domain-containing protein [Vibrio gallaecicus]|uniref:ParB N-terminal domain-containing protein n=1 Tax=Vibrio gallaecicus TaxID=552386 RepID=UPI0010C9F02E|nr:ParB N-terminal domain-containing protein [Vibrio gallaecicus]MDN3617274.1 ParB N-terminal domain-containing protein [Vibrio gallaecicus]